MVHPGGRPRTVSFEPPEMEELGKKMIEWLHSHPDTLHLSEWYTIHMGFTYKEWKTFIQKKEFIPYYEQGLKIVGKQYLDKNSNVRDGISQRWQRIYFPDLKEQEDEDMQLKLDKELDQKKALAEFEINKKASTASQSQTEDLQKALDLINYLQSKSDRKIEDKSKINE